MKKIHVNASLEYDVVISRGIIAELGKHLGEIVSPCRAAVISDDKVFELYGEKVVTSLKSAGFDICHHVFKNGEKSKNMSQLETILEFLAENRITRGDIIVAVGGGVTGDMAGFAAAVYLRGIRFVQVPTTFLAAVDASVGGKTAVDLKHGKNLAGVFHQSTAVFCDPDTFETLEENVYADGIAEAVKCGMLRDGRLFELMNGDTGMCVEEVIERSVVIKRDVVEEDEFDTGSRQLLNFGHTIGHAIEKCSDFEISHGHAVAAGMAIITKAAEKAGICKSGTYEELCKVLKNSGLPTECGYSAEELYDVILSDKKRVGNSITVVLPKEIGNCILQKMSVEEMYEFVKKGF